MSIKLQETADLFSIAKEIFTRKLHFLWSEGTLIEMDNPRSYLTPVCFSFF